MFIPPKDYVKFINNLKYYFDAELQEVKFDQSSYKGMLLRKQEKGYLSSVETMVIGKLRDIEIMFLHYDSFPEAKNKWDKRKTRINYNNLIVKFNDQNEFELDDYYEFEKTPYQNKVFFSSNKKLKGQKDVFYINKYESLGFALDDMHCGFEIKEYLNSLIHD